VEVVGKFCEREMIGQMAERWKFEGEEPRNAATGEEKEG